MSKESRKLAGILLVIYPTVIIGGFSILTMLINDPHYMANPLRQDLWRAGHAHAGVLLLLSLVILRMVDQATLMDSTKRFVRLCAPIAAILVPAAFFLSMLRPDTVTPNALVYLAYAGGAVLAAGLIALGIGLIRPAQ